MITAFVQFKLPETANRQETLKAFSSSAPNYQKIEGLIRKYYLLSQDGEMAGGVYLWKSQEDAEKLYNEDWKNFILEKYGSTPTVTYFDCSVVVDNLVGEIIEDF